VLAGTAPVLSGSDSIIQLMLGDSAGTSSQAPPDTVSESR